MPPIAACADPEEPTCNELKALEQGRAQQFFEKLCSQDASINDVLQALIFPPWITDRDDQRKKLIDYLTRHALCHPTNHAGVDCDDEEPCLDPQPTYCPDPDKCPSKWYGYGLLEVIRAAIRADSMLYMPVRDFDLLAAGEPLVWDPAATPDNRSCEPCDVPAAGALVPQHVYETEHPGG